MSIVDVSNNSLSEDSLHSSDIRRFGFGKDNISFLDHVRDDIPKLNYSSQDLFLISITNSMTILSITDSFTRERILDGARKVSPSKELNPLILVVVLFILDKYNMRPPRSAYSNEEPIILKLLSAMTTKLSGYSSAFEKDREIKSDTYILNALRIEIVSYTLMYLNIND